jgi:hypothetical protein
MRERWYPTYSSKGRKIQLAERPLERTKAATESV